MVIESDMKILHVLGIRNGERTLQEIEELLAETRRRRHVLRLMRRRLQKRAQMAEAMSRRDEEEEDGAD